MKAFKKFSCAECGGAVDLSPSNGRTLEYAQGYDVPIPNEFMIPTCSRCGEMYIVAELEEELYPVLEKQFLQMQAAHYRELIDILIKRHGVKQLDIVRACAVTPAYLSHVLNGKRVASTTLTRLLEAFVACGAEFERHRKGRHWSSQDVGLYAVKMPKIQGSAKTVSWEEQDTLPQWKASEQAPIDQSCLVGQAA